MAKQIGATLKLHKKRNPSAERKTEQEAFQGCFKCWNVQKLLKSITMPVSEHLFLSFINNGCSIFTKISITILSLWSFSEFCDAKYLALEIHTTYLMYVNYFSGVSS